MSESVFRLADPGWLWLLTALPLLVAWQVVVARRRRGAMRYSDLSLMRGLAVAPSRVWIALPPALRLLALALLVVAMARPQAGDVQRDILTEGVDIMLVLDCSDTMRADDFHPNRLEAAKAVIGEFIGKRESDRIGLVVFGRESFTVCPLTLDRSALGDFLGRVRIGVVDPDGTAIGQGLLSALHRLRDSEAASRVILLLTDGENNAGIDPLMLAPIAHDLGIKIYTIGVGTLQFRGFQQRGFNPELLTALATETGGEYFEANDRSTLAQVYRRIDALERSEVEMTEYAQWDELMMLLVWAALALFAVEIALRTTRLMGVPS